MTGPLVRCRGPEYHDGMALAQHRTSTILVADFDSLTQAAAFGSALAPPAASSNSFKAALRFVDVVGAHVVLTAPMVFDGAFFLFHGPAGIREILGMDSDCPLPLTVTSIDPTLDDWLGRRGQDPGFRWVSTKVLASSLAWSPDRIESARLEWLEELRGQSQIVDKTTFPTLFGQALEELCRPLGADALCEEAATILTRSALLDRLGKQDLSDLPVEVLAAVRAWWEWAYASAIARQHDAEWLELSPSPAVVERNDAAGGNDRFRVEGRLLVDLGKARSTAYSQLHDQTDVVRREWGRGRVTSSLRTLSMIVDSAGAPRYTWLQTSIRHGLWTLLLISLALASLLSIAFPGWTWLLAITVAGVVITEVPWVQLWDFYKKRPTQMDAVVHVRRAV